MSPRKSSVPYWPWGLAQGEGTSSCSSLKFLRPKSALVQERKKKKRKQRTALRAGTLSKSWVLGDHSVRQSRWK